MENADDDDDYITDDERVKRSPKRRKIAVPPATVTEEVSAEANMDEQNDVYTLTVCCGVLLWGPSYQNMFISQLCAKLHTI
jgi:hypothetical protein